MSGGSLTRGGRLPAVFRCPDGVLRGLDGPLGLDALWRHDPAFVGPVEPPMVRWLRMGSPPSAWQVAAAARRAAEAPPAGEQLAFDFGEAA